MADDRRLTEEKIAISDILRTSNDLHQCMEDLHDAIKIVSVPLAAAQAYVTFARAAIYEKAENTKNAQDQKVLLLKSISANCFVKALEKVNHAIALMKDLKNRLNDVERYAADVARRVSKAPIKVKTEKIGLFGIKRSVNTLILDEKSELSLAFGVSAATELNIQRCKAIKERLEQLAKAFSRGNLEKIGEGSYKFSERAATLFNKGAVTIATELAPVKNVLLAAFNAAGTVQNSVNHMYTIELQAMTQEQVLRKEAA